LIGGRICLGQMGIFTVRSKRLVSALPALVALCGCRAPTQVMVEISTDISCSDNPRTGISEGSLSELESRPMSTETLTCDPATGRIGSIVVVPGGEKDAEFAIRVVTGLTMTPDDCVRSGYLGGCVVARRVLRFEPHDTLYLPIRMEASCLDVPCGATQTCRDGSCVSATITGPGDGSGGRSNGGTGNANGGASGMDALGGAANGGSGGNSGSSGSGGTAGDATGGMAATPGGAPSASFTPACASTKAGALIYEDVACTPSDTQLCYQPCGPISSGYKSLSCTSGAYAEGSCQFPSDVNYSCFQVPQVDSPQCPTTVPQSGQPCSLAKCSLPCTGGACEMCGAANGYRDSLGTAKAGYCVCVAGSGGDHWSCSSNIAWPCPGGKGC